MCRPILTALNGLCFHRNQFQVKEISIWNQSCRWFVFVSEGNIEQDKCVFLYSLTVAAAHIYISPIRSICSVYFTNTNQPNAFNLPVNQHVRFHSSCLCLCYEKNTLLNKFSAQMPFKRTMSPIQRESILNWNCYKLVQMPSTYVRMTGFMRWTWMPLPT